MAGSLADIFLFVEPMQHYLEYSSLVLHDLIAANKQPGQTILELIGTDANPTKIREQLASLNPMVFGMCGHGSYDSTTVECTTAFMSVNQYASDAVKATVDMMKDRIVHTNSCQCAAVLGPAIMTAGALAYVGSSENFTFSAAAPANSNRLVQSVFLAEWAFEVALLQGKSVGEARQAQLDKYNSEIDYWLTGAGKNDVYAADIADVLQMNLAISSFAGTPGTVPSPVGGGIRTAGLATYALLPVAIVAALTFWWMTRKK